MADYPPFMNAYGNIDKIIQKIKEAKTPERFTADFLSTNLGMPGGNRRAFIPVAKRMGLLNADGSPTDLYKALRNPAQSKAAMAAAMRKGYATLFERNEYANKLDKKQLDGLVTEITGLENGHGTARAIVGSFEAFKAHADFDAALDRKQEGHGKENEGEERSGSSVPPTHAPLAPGRGVNLAYTIYLNLPDTDDMSVFNAIFRSLRENLLS